MSKIIKRVFFVLAIILLILVMVFFFYFPKYLFKRTKVELKNPSTDQITIMSSNVRCITPEDLFKRSWFFRAGLVVEDINRASPDIIGFQEVTWVHYSYLQKALSGYDSVILYRDKFILSEACPIFFRKDKFNLIDSGGFWLSETPDVMSKSWNSSHYRVCSFVVLEEIISGKQFAVFNAHLDNKSEQARIEGIKIVTNKIHEFGDLPAFLLGDMNAQPQSDTITSILESFDDCATIAVSADQGPTYHGFGDDTKKKRIDYIFVSKGGAEVYEYRIINNHYKGVYSSDHYPLYIKAKLK